jgi:hypothetical protein
MSLVIEVVGYGYVDTPMRWESTARLNAGGRWSFSMPASDANAALLGALRTVRCWWRGNAVAMGIVSSWRTSNDVIQVSGEDMSRELATRLVSAQLTDGESAVSLHDAVDWLFDELPAGWTGVNAVDVGNTAVVYLRSTSDSVLAVLGTICDLCGCWYTVDGRTLTVSDTLGAEVHGVTLLALEEQVDSADIINRIYLRGAGDGEAGLTLGAATDAPPTGYSVDGADSTLSWDASPYPLRERAFAMPWIGPIATTDSAVESAGNALLSAGVRWLQRYATPVVSYRATVVHPALIQPLERVALNWRGRGLAANGLFAVVEAVLRIDPRSLATVALTLEADARRLPTDVEVLASEMQTANRKALWPQVSLSSETVESESKLITDAAAEIANVMTWPARIVQVRSALLSIDVARNDQWQLPASVEWRLNGAGGWTTYTAPVSLMAQIGTPSGRPLAASVTVNVRGVAPAQKVKATGVSIDGAPTVVSGDVLLVLRSTKLVSSASNRADWDANTYLIANIPPGTLLVRGSGAASSHTIFDPIYGSYSTGQFVPVWFGEMVGYTLLYHWDSNTRQIQPYPVHSTDRVFTTAHFRANVRTQLTVRASILEQ